MTTSEREALAAELLRVEVALQRAHAAMDGSAESRTRLALVREEYRRAEAAALQALGAEDALNLGEAKDSQCAHTAVQDTLWAWAERGERELPLRSGGDHA